MFFCSLELGTLATHSGYNFPLNFNSLQHDWHHCSFPPVSSFARETEEGADSYTENYGPTGILDNLHGSNVAFKAWMAELTARGDGVDAREELVAMEKEALRKGE